MSIRNIFRRVAPSPSPAVPEPRAAPLTLASPPPYQPVPGNSADPLDAAVTHLWLVYQRRHYRPSWSLFVADLRATNAELKQRLKRTETDITEARSNGTFQP